MRGDFMTSNRFIIYVVITSVVLATGYHYLMKLLVWWEEITTVMVIPL